jgi:hypothetical protein
MNGESKASSPRSFRGLNVLNNVLAAMVVAIASSATPMVAGETIEWTKMYVPYNLDGNYTDAESLAESILDYKDEYDGSDDDNEHFSSDNPERQHLHLFQNPSDKPTPVLFFSHAMGGIAEDLSGDLEFIATTGYSVISWESVGKVHTLRDFETPWADFELVWEWFEENAAFYNFDPNFVVIAGRSRGTMCSWKMAHSGKPAIKGIYMFNALPDPYWLQKKLKKLPYNDTETDLLPPDKILSPDGSSTFWEEAITVASPRARLLFQQECPKPIRQDCLPSPDKFNMHNPSRGQTIVDRYNELRIGSRIQLTDGLKKKNIGIWDEFPMFAASLSSSTATSFNQKLRSSIFVLMMVSFCGFCAVYGYDKCYKRTQYSRDPVEYQKVIADDGVLRMQDMDSLQETKLSAFWRLLNPLKH